MKRIFDVLVLLLAAHFVLLAGGATWLYQAGHLDRAKMIAVREVLFPAAKLAPATQPAPRPATQPILRLEELLANQAGRPASEQLEYIRTSFDAQMAQLERSHRELTRLQAQVMAEKQKLADDRTAFEKERQALAQQVKESQRLSADKGFQDSLALYESLPPKQVKTIFMAGMDDQTAISYLQAMESRNAAKIMKEFKTPAETERLKKLLERMRQPQAAAKE